MLANPLKVDLGKSFRTPCRIQEISIRILLCPTKVRCIESLGSELPSKWLMVNELRGPLEFVTETSVSLARSHCLYTERGGVCQLN